MAMHCCGKWELPCVKFSERLCSDALIVKPFPLLTTSSLNHYLEIITFASSTAKKLENLVFLSFMSFLLTSLQSSIESISSIVSTFSAIPNLPDLNTCESVRGYMPYALPGVMVYSMSRYPEKGVWNDGRATKRSVILYHRRQHRTTVVSIGPRLSQ